jgi:hypothetical protein
MAGSDSGAVLGTVVGMDVKGYVCFRKSCCGISAVQAPDLDWGSPTATSLSSPSPLKAPSSFSRLQAGNKQGLSAHGPNFAARAGPAESPAR